METTELIRQVRHIFDPLSEKLEFGEPLEDRQNNTSFSVAYPGTEVGLQLFIDVSDFFIYALLFKPSVTGLPIGYRDDQGTRQKLYLQEALSELSIDGKAETLALQKLWGRIVKLLALSACIGSGHGQD